MGKRQRERVSIILPFFRSGAYLREAIESVLAQQDSPDWKLYLINDGSEGEDVQIAGEFCGRHPGGLQLLEHPGRRRRGISASRNLGIRSASGDLIAFLDADDVWYPHKLKSQVLTLDAHPFAHMIYGPAIRWYSWNGGLDVHVPASVDGFGSDCLVPGTALLQTFLRDESLTPCTGSVVIRRAALRNSGLFEDQFWGLYDDQVLYAKLCLAGSVYVSSDSVSKYRKHPHSCCSQAAADGTAAAERARFLSWLDSYKSACCQKEELSLSVR